MSDKLKVLLAGDGRNPLLYDIWGASLKLQGMDVSLLCDYPPNENVNFPVYSFLRPKQGYLLRLMLSLLNPVNWWFTLPWLLYFRPWSINSVKHLLYTVYAFSYRSKVLEILSQNTFDIIHLHYAFQPLCMVFLSLKSDISFVLSTWGSDIFVEPERSFIREKQLQHLMDKALFVHTESVFQKAYLKNNFTLENTPVYPISWGIDLEADVSLKDSRQLWKKKLKLPPDCKIIVSMRKLSAHYRIDQIIEAFIQIADDPCAANAVLIIGSYGPDADALQAKARLSSCADRIFFTGKISDDEVYGLLKDADLYIQYPLTDGVSQTLLSAMYTQSLCVTSDCGDNKSLIQDGENGFLSADLEKSLPSVMRKMLQLTPVAAKKVGSKARQTVSDFHDRGKNMQKVISLYQNGKNIKK